MSDELEAGELRPLPDRVEAVRRRWSADWITDEGYQYVFARGDIRTVMEGYDDLAKRLPELHSHYQILFNEYEARIAEYDAAIAEAYASGVNRGYRGYGLGRTEPAPRLGGEVDDAD